MAQGAGLLTLWRHCLRGSNPRRNARTTELAMSAEDTEDGSTEEDDDLQYFVRIGQTDLDGTKSVERSLTDMKGIGRRAARIIAEKAAVDRRDTFGLLDEEEIDAVVDVVENL